MLPSSGSDHLAFRIAVKNVNSCFAGVLSGGSGRRLVRGLLCPCRCRGSCIVAPVRTILVMPQLPRECRTKCSGDVDCVDLDCYCPYLRDCSEDIWIVFDRINQIEP